MLEFFYQPVIDMTYFGCPDSCIVPDSQQHVFLNFLVTPMVWLIIGVGAGLGVLKRLGLLKFKRKPKEQIRIPEYASRIVETEKDLKNPKAKLKREKKEFMLRDSSNDLNPENAFEKFVGSLDPEHPQTERLQSAPTVTKEIIPPEQEVLNQIEQAKELERQEKEVKELMKKENISEDEAVDRVIAKSMPDKPIIPESISDEDIDVDIFKQDIPPKKYPKQFKIIEKKLKKKPKPKTKSKLNDLGKLRRDQYAVQIEKKLMKWTFPLTEYKGKNKDSQLNQEEVILGIKKLALFLSMGEFMADRPRKKKRYWQKVRLE